MSKHLFINFDHLFCPVNLENLMEAVEEGDWVTLETEDGERYSGRFEVTREYTPEQRDELRQNKEYFDNPQPDPEYTHIPEIEPEGEIIVATIDIPDEDYEIEINPMSTVTHVSLKERGKLTDLPDAEAYMMDREQILNRHQDKIDLEYTDTLDYAEMHENDQKQTISALN